MLEHGKERDLVFCNQDTFYIHPNHNNNELLSEEAASSCSTAEICLKKLNRIPGHVKGRAASTKQILATENLRMELELKKEKSKVIEEEIEKIKIDQAKFQAQVQEDQMEMKNKMDRMMAQLSQLGSPN